jgi:dihydroorotate dehydrogenase (fumarate)
MDLSTTYLGLTLKNPLVPSASPLSQSVESIRRLEDAGAAAVVMYSLFEEQLVGESEQLDHFLSYGTESFAEALSYYPEMEDFRTGPDEYLNLIRQAKEAVDIPIVGSLNGVSTGGWVSYASDIQQAGADALELNIYYIPTSVDVSGAEVEAMYVDVVRDVKANVSIPVAVKLSPFFSATAHMARQLAEAGADALVMFNRFYQPDIDLEALEVVPRLVLSSSYEMHLPLRWVALLYGRVKVDFAITSGVHTHIDVLKGLMAGANVIMMASALLQVGPAYLSEVLENVGGWMTEHEYESVAQLRGSMSQQHVAEPAAFERANYMKVLQSWRADPSTTGFKK